MIDYGTAEAHTTYGLIGIKVWVNKGEMLPNGDMPVEVVTPREEERRPRRSPRGDRPDGKPGGRPTPSRTRGPRKPADAATAAVAAPEAAAAVSTPAPEGE